MSEHPTSDQTVYIHHLRHELRLPTNVFMEALYRGYGVVLIGRLSRVEACEAIYILRRVALGYLVMPSDPCDLFIARLEVAA